MHPDVLRLARTLREIPPNRPVTLVWSDAPHGPMLSTQLPADAPGERIVYPNSAHAIAVAWAILEADVPRTYRTYQQLEAIPAPRARKNGVLV